MADAPAATPETAAPATPAAEVTPSDAARILASQRSASGRLSDKLDEQRARLDRPPEPEKPLEQKKPDVTTADRLAALRAKKGERTDRKAIEAKRAELEARDKDPTTAKGRAAAELAAKGDLVGALKAFGLTDAQLYDGDQSVFWQLHALASKGTDDKPDPVKEAERVALEAIARQKQADKEAAEAARVAKMDADDQAAAAQSKAIDDAVSARMAEREAELPGIKAHGGIPPEWVSNWEYAGKKYAEMLKTDDEFAGRYIAGFKADVQRREGRAATHREIHQHLTRAVSPGFVEWHIETHGRAPTPDEVLNNFEAHYQGDLDRKLAAARPQRAAQPATPGAPKVPSNAWRASTGSPTAPVERAKTLAEAVARQHAKLEGTG